METKPNPQSMFPKDIESFLIRNGLHYRTRINGFPLPDIMEHYDPETSSTLRVVIHAAPEPIIRFILRILLYDGKTIESLRDFDIFQLRHILNLEYTFDDIVRILTDDIAKELHQRYTNERNNDNTSTL